MGDVSGPNWVIVRNGHHNELFFSIPYVTILICYMKLYIISSSLFCLDKRVLL